MEIFVWSELASGGIDDYAHHPANDPADQGVKLLHALNTLAVRECRCLIRWPFAASQPLGTELAHCWRN